MLINTSCARCGQAFQLGEFAQQIQWVYHVGLIHTEVTEKTDLWVHLNCDQPLLVGDTDAS